MPSSRSSATALYAGTVILLLAPSLAFQAAADLLTSYEQWEWETDRLAVTPGPFDPNLVVSWPLEGGIGGVPVATDGSYVLKMEWNNETDHEVAIRHEWTDFTFDLPGIVAGVAEMQVDVYIGTAGAIPGKAGVWSLWDDDPNDAKWIVGWPVPTTADKWVTVSMYVGDLRHYDTHQPYVGLGHIDALVFGRELEYESGTIYVDNLRLAPATQRTFAGRTWSVKHAALVGPGMPGGNYFSASPEIVWVDEDGLHLKVAQRDALWLCSEVICNDSLGYGSYVYTVHDCVDLLDQNIILGLYTWDTYADPNLPGQDCEIDIEFGTWGDPNAANAQYVVRPDPEHRFNIDYSGPTELTTHVMTWRPDEIRFESYYGSFSLVPATENVIETWVYTGANNPPPGGETVRMNLWLFEGLPPANGQDAEVVISDFQHFSSLLAAFAECMDGPDVSHPPGCEYADTDGDGDVDLADFAAFQQAFEG